MAWAEERDYAAADPRGRLWQRQRRDKAKPFKCEAAGLPARLPC
jgi:hypothetical protein